MPTTKPTPTPPPSMVTDLREAVEILKVCAAVKKMAGDMEARDARLALAHRLELYAAQAADI